MKRISTFIMVLACTLASAQTIDDVLRYSTENLQGTARFQARQLARGRYRQNYHQKKDAG